MNCWLWSNCQGHLFRAPACFNKNISIWTERYSTWHLIAILHVKDPIRAQGVRLEWIKNSWTFRTCFKHAFNRWEIPEETNKSWTLNNPTNSFTYMPIFFFLQMVAQTVLHLLTWRDRGGTGQMTDCVSEPPPPRQSFGIPSLSPTCLVSRWLLQSVL